MNLATIILVAGVQTGASHDDYRDFGSCVVDNAVARAMVAAAPHNMADTPQNRRWAALELTSESGWDRYEEMLAHAGTLYALAGEEVTHSMVNKEAWEFGRELVSGWGLSKSKEDHAAKVAATGFYECMWWASRGAW